MSAVAPGRQQPKPLKLKRMAKLKDQEVVGGACGSHATAIVSKDGKMFLFGSLEDDLVDKTTGGVGFGTDSIGFGT